MDGEKHENNLQKTSKAEQRNATFFKGLKIFTTVVISISTIGFLWQFTEITRDYLRKDVVTQLEIKTPRTMELPDISFCDHLPFVINFTDLNYKYPDFVTARIQGKYPNISTAKDFSEHLKYKDIFIYIMNELVRRFDIDELDQLTYKYYEIFKRVHIIQTNGRFGYLNKSEFDERCDWKTFFQEKYYCYRLSCSKKSLFLFTENDLQAGRVKGEVVSFKINEDIFKLMDHFNIFAHSQNTYPHGLENPSILVTTHKSSQITYFTFKKFKTTLMPPPYTTNCKVYRDSDGRISSRLQTMEQCQNDISLKMWNCPFYGNVHFAIKNATHGYLRYFVEYNTSESRDMFRKIFAACSAQKLQPDCEEEYFIPIETLPRKWKSNYTYIILSKPSEPDIINTASEKLSFTQYLILVESLMSTYFGVTFAFTLPQFIRWLYTRPKKFRRISKNLEHLRELVFDRPNKVDNIA